MLRPSKKLLVLIGMASVLSSAQTAISPADPPASQSQPWFPNPRPPYTARSVAPPLLANSLRLADLVHDGKLMLSLDDAIALTLENNLDLGIARYNIDIADTDILRTASGATTLGVNAGVVQNTPGGGVGGLNGTIGSGTAGASGSSTTSGTTSTSSQNGSVGSGTGGTSAGSAGAGAGTNGLVSSTEGLGPAISSFDPTLAGTLQIDHNHTFASNFQSGVPIVNTNTDTADFSYNQGFHWGMTAAVTFNNIHTTSNNTTPLLSPSVIANWQIRLTQPLLQGRGKLPNERYIVIAANNRNIMNAAFRLQVITTVDQIETLYWNLVYAYQNVKVDEDAVAYSQKILADTKTEVRYGTAQPIQISSAASTVATNQQTLTLARTNLQLQQLLMKNAVSRVYSDPLIADAEVVPTSTMKMPGSAAGPSDLEALVSQALASRPELAESQVDLQTRKLNTDTVANSLLPTVNPGIYYGGSGLGGDINPNIPVCTGGAVKRCFNPATAPPPFRNGGPVSYGNVLKQTVEGTAPDRGAALSLNAPLRNRYAQANQIRSELELRQAQIRLQQLENQVRIEVRNAQFELQQNRSTVQSAEASLDVAKQNLHAAERELQEGTGTPDAVLQNQSSLTTAQAQLLSALVAYEESEVELDRATGQLLEHAGISLADSLAGRVTQQPHVADVVPAASSPSQP